MPEASPLATNMGVLVRDGSFLPLHYTDWRYVPVQYIKYGKKSRLIKMQMILWRGGSYNLLEGNGKDGNVKQKDRDTCHMTMMQTY